MVKELINRLIILVLSQSVTASWFRDYCVWNPEVLEPQAQNTTCTSFGYRPFPPDVHLVSAVNELYLPEQKQE